MTLNIMTLIKTTATIMTLSIITLGKTIINSTENVSY
jgi:hypothetical protein